jgi:hypothetical protein
VSAIPITEKLLLNAGGWQAMKPARELLKGGRVSEAKYEPPLLTSLHRGYGLAGVAGGGAAPACESRSRSTSRIEIQPQLARERFRSLLEALLGMGVRPGESVLWRTGRELDRHDMVARGELRKFREQGRDVLKGALREEETTIAFGMTK